VRLGACALTLAAVALAAAARSPASRDAACSLGAAKTAVIALKVQVPGLGGGTLPIAPNQVDKVICFDFTRDGRTDMAATVFSGGTAGDIAWIVLRSTPAGWKLSLARAGYKLGLFRLAGDLAVSQPIYRKNDANCCPTGGFDHTRWHWNGKRFVVVRTWHDGRFTS
jgi:hypothetical protein